MFEEEAKEYVNEEYDSCYYPEDNFSARKNAECDWQNGAEFGYNKANEWHYVRDGDYPPERLEGKQILIMLQKYKFVESKFVIGYYLLADYHIGTKKKFYFDSDCKDEIDSPYAWKEIIFPELLKESE